MVCHHPELAPFVERELDAEALDAVEGLLDDWGTLRIESLANGLVPAVSGAGGNEVSGYDSVWLRDSVHVAHALWRCGDTDAARRVLESLLAFQVRTVDRFDAILEGRVDPSDPQQRPHVRFDGVHLREKPEPWAHAQNDALAYVLWLAASMWSANAFTPDPAQCGVIERLPRYFDRIAYERDADSGHWEEDRRVNASSVGCVVAALETLARVLERRDGCPVDLEPAELRALARRGRERLAWSLPHESPPQRRADAALLFLLEPLHVLDDVQELAVLAEVDRELLGPYGIRRYRGDSYWCADYRELVRPEARSTDYSTTTAERDRLLRPGTEAQWCIFDPVLAVWFGGRFARTGAEIDRQRFDQHLRRSLGQITGPGEWCAPGLCPEAWFLASSQEGVYRPNDQTPLAWTQAGLRWALHRAREIL